MNNLTTLNPLALEQLQESSELRNLESFFNNALTDPPVKRKLWSKPEKIHIEKATSEEEILLEGSFQKQGKRTKIWKTRFYVLTTQFLAYKEVRGELSES